MSPRSTTTNTRTTTPAGITHSEACRELAMAKAGRIIDAIVREGVARMVAVLKEAGEPLPTEEVCKRLRMDGEIPYWPDVCVTAIEEEVVWSPEDGMLCLPQKGAPKMSPEEQAQRLAFAKAKGLGVIRQAGQRFVLTNRQASGLLTPAEIDMAERWMNCCNALESPEVKKTTKLWEEGKATYEELDALESEVFRRAGLATRPRGH